MSVRRHCFDLAR